MKRVTIDIDEEVLASLNDYARDSSRENISPFNVSSAVRKLLGERLGELGYYHLAEKKQPAERENILVTNPFDQKNNKKPTLKTYSDTLHSFSIRNKRKRPIYVSCTSNLSWTVMNGYLGSLESLGFIEALAGDEKRIYKLSRTAFDMLGQYLETGE
jgi:predicted transcriptional regulator